MRLLQKISHLSLRVRRGNLAVFASAAKQSSQAAGRWVGLPRRPSGSSQRRASAAFVFALLTMAQLLFPATSFASGLVWKIVPATSSIAFSALQNGAPVKGKFTTFTGQIDFDPNQLSESKAKIVVDLNSVSTSYQDLTDALKTADWFNMKLFPEAVFVATKFEKTADNHYQANGMLTIRDQTVPVTLTFMFTADSPAAAVIRGSTILKRTTFGVGQGEWASVVEVQDDVKVNFVVSLVK